MIWMESVVRHVTKFMSVLIHFIESKDSLEETWLIGSIALATSLTVSICLMARLKSLALRHPVRQVFEEIGLEYHEVGGLILGFLNSVKKPMNLLNGHCRCPKSGSQLNIAV